MPRTSRRNASAISDLSRPRCRRRPDGIHRGAKAGVIALYQGQRRPDPAHSAIARSGQPVRSPTRGERLNERVKYREAIRPLAPMATLERRRSISICSKALSDGDYNAYNSMVLTAQSKPMARDKIPAVIHADGTGRVQIVRGKTIPSPMPT